MFGQMEVSDCHMITVTFGIHSLFCRPKFLLGGGLGQGNRKKKLRLGMLVSTAQQCKLLLGGTATSRGRNHVTHLELVWEALLVHSHYLSELKRWTLRHKSQMAFTCREIFI